jgi:hypothetical protein
VATNLSDDTIILGEPADPVEYEIAWSELIHSVTGGFFDERDPACPIGPTVAKLAGVVAAVTGVVLAVLAAFGMIVVWTFHAIFA